MEVALLVLILFRIYITKFKTSLMDHFGLHCLKLNFTFVSLNFMYTLMVFIRYLQVLIQLIMFSELSFKFSKLFFICFYWDIIHRSYSSPI